jgi:IS5 family transposase
MYRCEHRDQLSFKDFFLPFGGQLSGDNSWIKLAELIPWDELEDDYTAQFCKGFGASEAISHGPGGLDLDYQSPHGAHG